MRAEDYSEYLQSETWLWIKKRKLENNRECHRCGWDRQLNVHHRNYRRVGGREFDGDLEVLCRRCHWDEHRTVADELQMKKGLGYSNADIQMEIQNDPDFIAAQKRATLIQELEEDDI